jgi:hypothetical protein
MQEKFTNFSIGMCCYRQHLALQKIPKMFPNLFTPVYKPKHVGGERDILMSATKLVFSLNTSMNIHKDHLWLLSMLSVLDDYPTGLRYLGQVLLGHINFVGLWWR